MNNLEVLFHVTTQYLACQFLFRILNEGRFLYRQGLSIIDTSKTVL
jgi:hypothetical protein